MVPFTNRSDVKSWSKDSRAEWAAVCCLSQMLASKGPLTNFKRSMAQSQTLSWIVQSDKDSKALLKECVGTPGPHVEPWRPAAARC